MTLILVAAAVAAASATPASPVRSVRFHEISPYGHVFVIDQDGQRVLRLGSTGGDNQSVLDLERPDTPVMQYLRLTLAGAALARKQERALVIGFGAGSVTRLWHRVLPEMWIDNVEIDPIVTAVAFLYFKFTPHERLPIHVMDGRAFVRSSGGGYDLVLLDAFGAGDAPFHLTTAEFYDEVKAKLAPGGVVVANMIAESKQTVVDQARTFRAAFATVYQLATTRERNMILIGTSSPRLADDAFKDRLRAFATARGLDFDLADVCAISVLQAGTTEGPVLRDETHAKAVAEPVPGRALSGSG